MEVLLFYARLLRLIDVALVLLAAGFFFLGIFCGPFVVEKDVRLLLRYPLWVWGLIKRHIDLDAPFFRLWLVIFCLNSLSLFCNVVSGFFIILPTVFSFLLGIHIAVIFLKEVGKLRLVFLSFGMRLGRELYLSKYSNALSLFERELMGYLFLILPLLAIAGVIEVALIKFGGRGVGADSGCDGEEVRGQSNPSYDKL
jgi:hypothetical protein